MLYIGQNSAHACISCIVTSLYTVRFSAVAVAKVASKTSGKAANCKNICSKNGLPKSALYHNYCICLE